VVNEEAPSYRPAGSLSISTALFPYAGSWNVRLAAHLLRRAGFGGSPADVARVGSLSMHEAVDELVHFPSPDTLPANPALPDETLLDGEIFDRIRDDGGAAAARSAGDSGLVDLLRQRRQTERQGIIAAQIWWLNRMIATAAPLQEKMTLFWHGHFTTAAVQKGVTPAEAVTQNELFRSFALGDMRALTQQISLDPAMLKYLDNIRNDRTHPNENYARELMELFTLGIGNYSEQDVREAARAWTGLRIRRGTEDVWLNPRLHDDGTKTFLGRTGDFSGTDIVDIIFEQPAAARFIAANLLDFFVYNDPEPQLVEAVADLVRKNNFNLQPVMSTILRSNVFYSDRAYRALVKSPVEFVVGSCKLFDIAQVTPQTLRALARMGQVLFYPPNVKGWPGGSTWLNSTTMLARENFANSLMTSNNVMNASSWLLATGPNDPDAAARALVGTIVQGDAAPSAVAQLEGFLRGDGSSALGMLSGENFDQRMRGGAYLTMAMPAYQLA